MDNPSFGERTVAYKRTATMAASATTADMTKMTAKNGRLVTVPLAYQFNHRAKSASELLNFRMRGTY